MPLHHRQMSEADIDQLRKAGTCLPTVRHSCMYKLSTFRLDLLCTLTHVGILHNVLQVFLVCSDASLFTICPVAPFQAKVPMSAVEHLLETSREQPDAAAQSTTQAWLDQVSPLYLFMPQRLLFVCGCVATGYSCMRPIRLVSLLISC